MESKQTKASLKYHELRGISARLDESDLSKYKAMMKRLKSVNNAGFSLSDLMKVIITMNSETLDKEISRYMATQSAAASLIKKLDVSDEAKARIAAIIAEEANRGA